MIAALSTSTTVGAENERAVAGLENAGFTVLIHSRIPANDGGISLGQAAIAAARDWIDVDADAARANPANLDGTDRHAPPHNQTITG